LERKKLNLFIFTCASENPKDYIQKERSHPGKMSEFSKVVEYKVRNIKMHVFCVPVKNN
jgi:hypothetical protein